ncbi:phosphoribosyl-AMP cyclohydrolase [Candidatus Bathyarchaeota archaeon]|nr:phosphoribosyl-AMP cyclohydrolase [Candidatus Bathyarchaeota archaeon]
MNVKIDELDWEKMNGLIPVVTQEAKTLEVLTLAFVNKEALMKTMETGWAYYYRRSHGKVMKKGETSGNVQKIVDVLTDCDNDAVVYLVDQTGPACHLGERTCFHRKLVQ